MQKGEEKLDSVKDFSSNHDLETLAFCIDINVEKLEITLMIILILITIIVMIIVIIILIIKVMATSS